MYELKSPSKIMLSYFDEGESMLLERHKGSLLVGGLMGGRMAWVLGSWGWRLVKIGKLCGGGAAYGGSQGSQII